MFDLIVVLVAVGVGVAATMTARSRNGGVAAQAVRDDEAPTRLSGVGGAAVNATRGLKTGADQVLSDQRTTTEMQARLDQLTRERDEANASALAARGLLEQARSQGNAQRMETATAELIRQQRIRDDANAAAMAEQAALRQAADRAAAEAAARAAAAMRLAPRKVELEARVRTLGDQLNGARFLYTAARTQRQQEAASFPEYREMLGIVITGEDGSDTESYTRTLRLVDVESGEGQLIANARRGVATVRMGNTVTTMPGNNFAPDVLLVNDAMRRSAANITRQTEIMRIQREAIATITEERSAANQELSDINRQLTGNAIGVEQINTGKSSNISPTLNFFAGIIGTGTGTGVSNTKNPNESGRRSGGPVGVRIVGGIRR